MPNERSLRRDEQMLHLQSQVLRSSHLSRHLVRPHLLRLSTGKLCIWQCEGDEGARLPSQPKLSTTTNTQRPTLARKGERPAIECIATAHIDLAAPIGAEQLRVQESRARGHIMPGTCKVHQMDSNKWHVQAKGWLQSNSSKAEAAHTADHHATASSQGRERRNGEEQGGGAVDAQ